MRKTINYVTIKIPKVFKCNRLRKRSTYTVIACMGLEPTALGVVVAVTEIL